MRFTRQACTLECCDHRSQCANKTCRKAAVPTHTEDDVAYADAETCSQYRSPEGREAEREGGTNVVLVGIWK